MFARGNKDYLHASLSDKPLLTQPHRYSSLSTHNLPRVRKRHPMGVLDDGFNLLARLARLALAPTPEADLEPEVSFRVTYPFYLLDTPTRPEPPVRSPILLPAPSPSSSGSTTPSSLQPPPSQPSTSPLSNEDWQALHSNRPKGLAHGEVLRPHQVHTRVWMIQCAIGATKGGILNLVSEEFVL